MNTSVNVLSSTARVSLSAPRRYLGQLCKHFGHKITATYDDEYRTGRIAFPAGPCDLEADEAEGVLTMRVSAANDDDLARLENVVGRHLERFAFREPLTVTWTRGA